MRVCAAVSPANSPLNIISNAAALCSSTPPTGAQSQLLMWAKWRSFQFEQSVKTDPPGIGEWVYYILVLVGWMGVDTVRGVCRTGFSDRALTAASSLERLIFLPLCGSSPRGSKQKPRETKRNAQTEDWKITLQRKRWDSGVRSTRLLHRFPHNNCNAFSDSNFQSSQHNFSDFKAIYAKYFYRGQDLSSYLNVKNV